MAKSTLLLCCLYFLAVVSVAFSAQDGQLKVTNTVVVDEHLAAAEVKESNLKNKCYDINTKSSYKIDSVWYPENKCEKYTCTRQKGSKTPSIKTMECEPCKNCQASQECVALKPQKQYPKCCPQCTTRDTLKKGHKMYKPTRKVR
ncbi:uncharacterized protein LOC126834865 [Adelges cooleyi]|uniref:uncharacterized protein LOC126834865 n=1 Tax=Adelges cooleyi TaxID=133065 RepID=UPI00218026AF|nr:uncharacterized protein LOC126834865 [Adelges cooleyi]